MTERANTIVGVLVLAYFVSIASTCSPVVRASAADHHSHAAERLVDHDGWCRSVGARTFLAAVCPCGCEERSAVLGARSGVGLALFPATAPLDPPSGAGVILAEPSHAPLPPVRSIDHVPLPA